MMVIIEEKKINEILTRGVENAYPSKEELKKVLLSGKKLSIYNGIDPTGPTLHIGHGSVLLKLREFQDLGHQIILLIGDFTGRIGDPTDKTAARRQLSIQEIKENMKLYTRQAGMILNMEKVEIKFNSKWLNKLSFAEGLELASEFTLQQMIERDMFERRIKEGQPIRLHEFFYPLLQGYDSVAMDVDMEIGGNDQTFNMLIGRTMMKNRGKEKYVLTTKLLTDSTGKKMGKSEGNMVTLADKPEEMFGKIMSWPDTLLPLAFEVCTRVSLTEIFQINKENPRDLKMKLAMEIVKIYHGEKKAQIAKENFIKTFQKKEIPESVMEVEGGEPLNKILIKIKFSNSNSEVFRLLKAGAIMDMTDNKKVSSLKLIVRGHVYRIGKHRFIKIK